MGGGLVATAIAGVCWYGCWVNSVAHGTSLTAKDYQRLTMHAMLLALTGEGRTVVVPQVGSDGQLDQCPLPP